MLLKKPKDSSTDIQTHKPASIHKAKAYLELAPNYFVKWLDDESFQLAGLRDRICQSRRDQSEGRTQSNGRRLIDGRELSLSPRQDFKLSIGKLGCRRLGFRE
jgi:hypothetical protein